jgi:hypothetical protein
MYLWRRCPYSTQSTEYHETRIPVGEKTDHITTLGRMIPASRGYIAGFECQDPTCSYFTGTAVTELTKVFFSMSNQVLVTGTINIMPGTYFFER